MSFVYVAIAVGGSALIGVGTAYYTSKQSSKAAAEATKAQEEGMTTEWNMFQQMRGDYAPWRTAGEGALTTLQQKMTQGPGEFNPQTEPGYEFGYKNFIEKPYTQAQGAAGKLFSGETLKGLTKYASDYASTKYDNFLNRYYQSLTPYQSLAGLGMNATTNTAQSGQGYANAISGMQGNIGQIQAQNTMNQGQVGMAVGGMGQNMLQNYMNYMMFKNAMGK
jgi:hypothetical protein